MEEEFRFYRPCGPLLPWVRFYWTFRSRRAACVRSFPTGCPMLLFHRGTPLRVPELERAQDRVTVSGQVDFPSHLLSDGSTELVAVVFRPWGLGRFVDAPLVSFFNREISGYDLEDRGLNALSERILTCDDPSEGVVAAERWLLARLAAEPRAAHRFDRVRGAVETLFAAPGTRVASLASRACLSPKQFERYFGAVVGMNPKAYARLVRFQLSLHAMERRGGAADWARIACDCGYADQSHFVREFRRLGGMTPAALARTGAVRSDLFADPF
ncbi:AraC family transcriptional regulator [uncultured Alistipes sp.]|uniref:helix-turn-helix domain-containing protein n=1 Tax=uncultured Alistipes sp. TaxID=538949 RepID=UPI003445DC45